MHHRLIKYCSMARFNSGMLTYHGDNLIMFEKSSAYFSLGEHFLDMEALKRIEALLHEFPLESITIGDAGEINNCQVGRLIEDQPGSYPRQMNDTLSDLILPYFKTQKALSFFRKFIKDSPEELVLRRC